MTSPTPISAGKKLPKVIDKDSGTIREIWKLPLKITLVGEKT